MSNASLWRARRRLRPSAIIENEIRIWLSLLGVSGYRELDKS
jgi:hypothetical protein